ncbi:hypothetical protein DL89DRAFT_267633 [Linderina pennispora]|uniref:Uncharacterized protein n=1 Tax=Linderina pennispora TaxID=61395 RepID=A0A1Y1W781_9FUNG|nr:uncharacterized protein DL89DRAFT_267633 [Linderina pennispora]ORX69399.1 hypothetical protein DL89DRAFT_267633 [Linderina pennispora]
MTSGGAIAGIVVGSVAGAALILAIAYVAIRNSRKPREKPMLEMALPNTVESDDPENQTSSSVSVETPTGRKHQAPVRPAAAGNPDQSSDIAIFASAPVSYPTVDINTPTYIAANDASSSSNSVHSSGHNHQDDHTVPGPVAADSGTNNMGTIAVNGANDMGATAVNGANDMGAIAASGGNDTGTVAVNGGHYMSATAGSGGNNTGTIATTEVPATSGAGAVSSHHGTSSAAPTLQTTSHGTSNTQHSSNYGTSNNHHSSSHDTGTHHHSSYDYGSSSYDNSTNYDTGGGFSSDW